MSQDTCISRRGAIASASLVAASTAMLAAGRVYGEEFAEAAPLSPTDAISFLYIDNARLEVGAEQSIVVSLSQHAGVSAAVLTVQDEAGAEQVCTVSGVQDNALLFTFVPSGMGSCEVACLQFKVDGTAYEIDLSEVDESYRSYTVAPMALAFSDGEAASGPDLHVYIGDDGDELAESGSIEEAASAAVAAASRSRAANPEKSGPLVIALDPGHVGVSSGAVANGASEANATWKIAQFCKAELDTYQNVTAVFTVTPDDRLGSSSELRERVQRALNQGADVLVSLHLNSTGVGNAYGAEVWAPHNTSYNNGRMPLARIWAIRFSLSWRSSAWPIAASSSVGSIRTRSSIIPMAATVITTALFARRASPTCRRSSWNMRFWTIGAITTTS